MIVVSFFTYSMNNLCNNFFFQSPKRIYHCFCAIADCIVPLVKSGPKYFLDYPIFDNTNLFVDQILFNSLPCQTKTFVQLLIDLRFLYLLV